MITEAMINKYVEKVKQEVIGELGEKFAETTDALEARIVELEEKGSGNPPGKKDEDW